ncbi:metallopeptidase M24 family protein [Actinidia rufa]|uniref:Metallopeptidase M24 family protein n=1 Tax=Actinidia rufa TaxID=165716 RepID=A0A7J0FW83_9ERIC|nr:metallopeptidase M24 family protein [Actinidia rufa]
MEFTSSSSSLSLSRTISLSPPKIVSRCCRLHSRCFRFFSASVPIFTKFKTSPSIFTKSPKLPLFVVRNSSSITAKPSSELRKKRSDSVQDAKLRALRELFLKPGIGIDAFIIPSQDAHQSEFIAECYMRRAYISGFTGSAGTAVVTKDKAALWTDGRYFLQAEKQLNSSWILMRAGNMGVPTTSEWLNDILAPGCRVGIDPFLFSSDAAEELKDAISKNNHEVVCLYDINLVDEVWKESRPKPPSKPVRVHHLKYAGVDVATKLSSLRSELKDAGASAIVISMLDEIAWLLNLRGNDVPHSPVMYAYLIVEMDGAKLFIDNSKVNVEVMGYLKNAGVEVRPYESILSEIESLAMQGAHLWLDTSSVNAAIVNTYKSACDGYFRSIGNKSKDNPISYDSSNSQSGGPAGICRTSPIYSTKAVKNQAELEGMRNSHLSHSPCRRLTVGSAFPTRSGRVSDEIGASFRRASEKEAPIRGSQGDSPPLCKIPATKTSSWGVTPLPDLLSVVLTGSGPNGAIIHYKPEPGSCSIVNAKKLFLLDSGAQYIDGTTDVTRTVHFGEPSAWEKECFTRVLQGHIALDQAVFPENTPGFVLDAFARSSLWKIGLDYRHGTGHGVGAALNVHEGPQSISFRFGNMTPLQKGMIVSNEPGYYEDHAFGIRIENLLHVEESDTPNRFGGIGYMGFEKLTFVPIQTDIHMA